MKRIITILTFAFLTSGIHAQERIENAPEVLIGKLENGLTYYLWQNSDPAGCADFYIVHNVGSLQEEDNQNGLAHFLEHMAFNGTKTYPDKEILNFLAKEGVRFGYNVNAYTSKNETVYNISTVPLVRESFVDSVLMVLHDWSCAISCDQDALDAERGVISEEWRRRDDPRSRMALKQSNLMYKGAKHAKRSVIGTLEVINGFKRDEILDFYHKWYRPDLQAIIIVGDFDVKDMESRVKKIFSDIPAPVNPVAKETYPIPALDKPLFEHMTDPEIKYFVLKVIHRHSFPTREQITNEFYLRDLYLRQIVSAAAEERFKMAARKDDSPVKSAVLVTNPSNTDFYMSLFTISPKSEQQMGDALAFYTREMKRLLQYGISEDEFLAAKATVTKKCRFDAEQKKQTRDLVNVCKENFLRGLPCVYPSDYNDIRKRVLESVTYDEALSYLPKVFAESEKIYSYSINEEQAGMIPSEEAMYEIIAAAEQEEVQPEFVRFKKLDMSVSPEAGKIIKVSPLKGYDAEIWSLSNGATVYWIPSDKVNGNVHLAMTAYFETGYSVFPQDRIGSVEVARRFIDRNVGLSNMDRMEIRSYPFIDNISVNHKIERKNAAVSINADSDNAEDGFRMFHLQLTKPNFSTETTFKKFKRENISMMKKKKSNTALFEEEKQDIRYGNHPWVKTVTRQDVEDMEMELVKAMYDASFSDFSNMTVYICSDLDRQLIMDYTTKYVASLKGEYTVSKVKYIPLVPAYKGTEILDRTYHTASAPKSEVTYSFLSKSGTSPKDRACIEILDYIMSGRYLNQIREARGGTYHVSFTSERIADAPGLVESSVYFQTRPEMTDILVGDVADLMAEIAEAGPTEEEIDSAVKFLIKRHAEKKTVNDRSLVFKMQECANFVRDGIDNDYDYEKVIRSIKASDIRRTAKSLDNGDRMISIYREQ